MYHSNVVPFIGFTGVDKTRTLLEICRNEMGNGCVTAYAAFPRNDSDVVQTSWSISSQSLLHWFRGFLDISSRFPSPIEDLSVLLCQVF
ncbi:hypothetical protein P9112_013396 [Eukaryota sp. TZLM1-RC]